MFVEGPYSDSEGREFVTSHQLESQPPTYPPDLLVVSPDRDLLGRLDWNASPEETIEFLRSVLNETPDLAPESELDAEDSEVSAAASDLAKLSDRFDHSARATLIKPLEEWLAKHAANEPDGAALARTMLGAARYHGGDYDGADRAWNEVLEHHPNHPLRHRARFNLLGGHAWPCGMHPDLLGATPPKAEVRAPEVPFPEVRAQNLAAIKGDERYEEIEGLPFVRVEAGTFLMGASAPPFFPRELPVREIHLSRPFLMSAWPVTRQLWHRFRPTDWKGEEAEGLAAHLPATQLSHKDALQFCEWMSAKAGRPIRLPTEAEWEYAVRGGLEKAPYPWGWDRPDDRKCNHAGRVPVPVGCYPPNGFGLFDMIGNCSEWCLDYYSERAYHLTDQKCSDPQGPRYNESDDGMRVVRSGLPGDTVAEVLCRNTWRLGFPDDFSMTGLGFRAVIPLD